MLGKKFYCILGDMIKCSYSNTLIYVCFDQTFAGFAGCIRISGAFYCYFFDDVGTIAIENKEQVVNKFQSQ